MVVCDNPAETCANHFLITSLLSPFSTPKEKALASGGHDGQGLVSRADRTSASLLCRWENLEETHFLSPTSSADAA
jgi:hypothetical protein